MVARGGSASQERNGKAESVMETNGTAFPEQNAACSSMQMARHSLRHRRPIRAIRETSNGRGIEFAKSPEPDSGK
jgi:hypothetical protein